MTVSRRKLLLMAPAMLGAPMIARAAVPFRFGLTPVFLDSDATVIDRLRAALSTERGIDLVQRRTYAEITGLLLEGDVDAAWLCGYPYLQHEEELSLLAVPVWQGAPLYRSYLITHNDDPASGLPDLIDGMHAFSDPNSNSGFLVTASDLARMGTRPETFFSRTIFAYGHRNVVRAVAQGLTRSGSVDGYVWEALTSVEPGLTTRTRVIAKSELLGFPPFVARRDRADQPDLARFKQALLGLRETAVGQDALVLLQLDDVVETTPALFDGIRARMRDVAG